MLSPKEATVCGFCRREIAECSDCGSEYCENQACPQFMLCVLEHSDDNPKEECSVCVVQHE